MSKRIRTRLLAGSCSVLLVPALAAAAQPDLRVLEALKSGSDRATVEALLQKGADVDAHRGDGVTALLWAVHRNDAGIAGLLIARKANVNAADDYGVTSLALACGNTNGALVETLLAAGANPKVAQSSGETPLMTCASRGSVEGVKALLARGADVNAAEQNDGQTALMWAAAEGHGAIVQALVEKGADVHTRSTVRQQPEPFVVKSNGFFENNYPPTVRFAKTIGGFTPLLFAAQSGSVESADVLLRGGARIEDGTEEHGTPLVVAIASGNEKLALFLIEKGANPNATDGYGITALHFALYEGLMTLAGFSPGPTDRFGWRHDNMPAVVQALLQRGANANARIRHNYAVLDNPFLARQQEDYPQVDMVGATPFLLAAASGDVATMKVLMENGADPRATTDDNASALMVAAGLGAERGMGSEKRNLEAVKLALQLGADVNSTKKRDGRTALHAAVFHGWKDMIVFLVEKGAKLDASDIYGQTPMLIAMGDPEDRYYRQLGKGNHDDRFRVPRPNPQIAELLVKLGAQPYNGTPTDRSGR